MFNAMRTYPDQTKVQLFRSVNSYPKTESRERQAKTRNRSLILLTFILDFPSSLALLFDSIMPEDIDRYC